MISSLDGLGWLKTLRKQVPEQMVFVRNPKNTDLHFGQCLVSLLLQDLLAWLCPNIDLSTDLLFWPHQAGGVYEYDPLSGHGPKLVLSHFKSDLGVVGETTDLGDPRRHNPRELPEKKKGL